MKISLSFVLDRIVQNLVNYNPEDKKREAIILDQIYFFEQSINAINKNNIEGIFGEIFEDIEIEKFDELNEFLKKEKKSDFLERSVLQFKHLVEFYRLLEENYGFLEEVFSELNIFYDECKPSRDILDNYRHLRYNRDSKSRIEQIGFLNHFTQSLHNNYLSLQYRGDQEAIAQYTGKFNDVLNKFYTKLKSREDGFVFRVTNIVMIGMGIKNSFEKIIEELFNQGANGNLSPLIFSMIFAQLPLYFIENQNDILIKSLSGSHEEIAIYWIKLLYKLKNKINQTKSIAGFAYILEKFGAEVDEINDALTKFYQIAQLKIVEITKIEKHPQSDRLNLCTVFDGHETKEVVCGGKNVHNIYENKLRTIYANIGQIIPCDMVLEPREIRGIISNGMLCSTEELCVDFPNNEIDGIAELSGEAILGQSPLSYILEKFNLSIIFDISITPNLDRMLDLYQIEELIYSYIYEKENVSFANLYLMNLRSGFTHNKLSKKFEINNDIIECEDKKIIDNIFFSICEDVSSYNGTSYEMKKLLISHGFEIRNNILDSVNFASIMTGAVPHLIDFDKVKGRLKVTKNNNQRKGLKENDVVIVDGDNNLVAVPGLYDSEDFTFNPSVTKKLLFLFIVFAENPSNDMNLGFNCVLRIARRERLSNKMLYFYERGRIDESFISSIFYILNGENHYFCINNDVNNDKYWFKPVKLFINDILMAFKKNGVLALIDDLQDEESLHRTHSLPKIGHLCALYLAKLGIIDFSLPSNEIFNIEYSMEDGLYCILPVFKHFSNINSSLDLVAEILKFIDFSDNQFSLRNGLYNPLLNNEVEYSAANDNAQPDSLDPTFYFTYERLFNEHIDSSSYSNYGEMKLDKKMQKALINRGFSELCNFSFIDKKDANCDAQYLVHLSSPVNKELSVLRSSIFSSLLSNLVEIFKGQNESIAIFELGSVYTKYNIFQKNISSLRAGRKYQRNIHINDKRDFDFYAIKADFLIALESYNINEDDLNFVRLDELNSNHDLLNKLKEIGLVYGDDSINQHYDFFHPGKSAIVYLKDIPLGYLGELHPKIIQKYEINSMVCGFTILLEQLHSLGSQSKKELFESNYQSVSRDLALIFDEDIKIKEIKDVIYEISSNFEDKILREVNFFDIYRDEKLQNDHKKSIAFNLKLQSKKETLSDKTINDFIDRVLLNLKEKLGGYMNIS